MVFLVCRDQLDGLGCLAFGCKYKSTMYSIKFGVTF